MGTLWTTTRRGTDRPCWDGRMPRLIDTDLRTRDMVTGVDRVLAAHGIPGLTMRLIARESGLSTGSLMHHFEIRERILWIACQRTGRAMIDDRGVGLTVDRPRRVPPGRRGDAVVDSCLGGVVRPRTEQESRRRYCRRPAVGRTPGARTTPRGLAGRAGAGLGRGGAGRAPGRGVGARLPDVVRPRPRPLSDVVCRGARSLRVTHLSSRWRCSGGRRCARRDPTSSRVIAAATGERTENHDGMPKGSGRSRR